MAISGNQLRMALRASGEKMNDIRNKTGLSESTFFWLFKRKIVSEEYIEMFEKLGYEIKAPVDYPTLLNLVRVLENSLEAERTTNKLLTGQIEMLSAIINKGIEKDYIFFNAVIAKIKKLPWIK